jgi:hypothetical protein
MPSTRSTAAKRAVVAPLVVSVHAPSATVGRVVASATASSALAVTGSTTASHARRIAAAPSRSAAP